jgi:hypothetical protein
MRQLSESDLSWETNKLSVERFRSIEKMNSAPIRADARNSFERFVRHCARYRVISRRNHPRGVFKFRSIEEAQAARQLSSCHPSGSNPQ